MNHKSQFLFILFTNLFLSSQAQHSVLNSNFDIRSLSMGRCGVALKNNTNFLNNTAHLSQINNSSIYTSSRSYYLVKGLIQMNVQGIYKQNSYNSWGVNGSYDGSSDLNESSFGIAYARNFLKNSSVGISFNYYRQFLPEHKARNAVYPSIGMQFQIIPKLILGSQLVNPLPLSSNPESKIPSLYKFGASYQIYSAVSITSELQLSSNESTFVRVGIEYNASNQIAIRTGYISNGSVSLGIAYKVINRIMIETAYELHPILRTSLGFGLAYQISK